jgi:GTPase SAR1 family protein
VREVKDNVHEEAVFFLIGTKLDLEDVRKVNKEEGEAYAKGIGSVFFQEISSKTGENVKEVLPSSPRLSTRSQNTSSKSTSPPAPSRTT